MYQDIEVSSKIQLLPEYLIDQIKAGEVVETPDSLIKELIENSIDANADKIEITIKNNGLESIIIKDNGEGMSKNDLVYAFCRHSTSKIKNITDLESLISFGFRGEALASIASVSQVTCNSNTKDQNGGRIIIHGGKQKSLIPINNIKGTIIKIENIFYNTPARLKFLRSKTYQKNAINKKINAFLISNPHIHFSIQWDDKEKIIYKKSDLIQRIKLVLSNKNQEYINISNELGGFSLKGFISKHCSMGNSGKTHFLFINNRLFKDKQLHQIIIKNMERYWPTGHTGNYMMFLRAPSNHIDVNIHPKKEYIRFFQPNLPFTLIANSIKCYFKYSKATPSKTEINTSKPSFKKWLEHGEQISNDYFITNSFYLIQRQESLLVNIRLLISYWLKVNFYKLPIEESNISPLLITEPFKFKQKYISHHLDFFNKYLGIECDQLDNQTLVVRTIPKFLKGYNISSILKGVFKTFNESKSNSEMILNSSLSSPLNTNQVDLSSREIKTIIENLTEKRLIKEKIIVILSDKNLSKIF